MRIVVATSSTGGHFFPALAFVEAFNQKTKSEVLFILPASNKIKEIFKNYPYRFEELKMAGAARKFSPAAIKSLWPIFLSFFKSRQILKRWQPDFVLSLGSYSALPVCWAAFTLKIPVFIFESNLVPGLSNRLTARFCRLFLAGFEKTKRYLKKKNNFKFVGIPVRAGFLEPGEKTILEILGFNPQKKMLLIFGGSQGARSLNEIVLKILAVIKNPPWDEWQIIHSSGPADFEKIKTKIQDLKIEGYYLAPFLDPLWRYLKAADLVICRAGASTVGEIMASRIPAIFVPYPEATDNHQYFNALALAEKGSAFLVKDDDLLFKNLQGIIKTINENPQSLEEIKTALKTLDNQRTASIMVEEIVRSLKDK